MTGKTIQQLQVGDKAVLRKTFIEEDVEEFARVSGDSGV